jgi:hypothetical protein
MAGASVLTVLFAYLLISSFVAGRGRGMDDPDFLASEARKGDFADPALRSMAVSIKAGNVEELKKQLDGKRPPAGKDRDGNDILAYAVLMADRMSTPESRECLRVLLETGVDSNSSQMPDGMPLLTRVATDAAAVRLLLAHHAAANPAKSGGFAPPLALAGNAPESVRSLVEAGADIEALHEGIPALVRFIGDRHWESALYLIEKGARLDTTGPEGKSVDFYLRTWKDDIYTAPIPEGWNHVRAAIAKRRGESAKPPHSAAMLL